LRKNKVWRLKLNVKQCRGELAGFLQEKAQSKLEVAVLPDFFLDRLINLDCDVAHFSQLITNIVKRKGGSVDGISQTDLRGGNAVNTASALSSLGVKVAPIVCTSNLGLNQLKSDFKGGKVDLSHVKVLGDASVTTAFEFKNQNEKANVMLRDLGALADFGPKNLTKKDYETIENSDYVCLFNWAGTLKFGTGLAEAVFTRAKTGKGKTYYDTADPTPNSVGIAELMNKVLKTSQVDILSLNENEAVTYAGMLDASIKERKATGVSAEIALESARVLVKHLPARIDLHTTSFAATVTRKGEAVVPAFKIKPLRATGAGDAWDAGNILGDANSLSDECRLMLANAVAACYLQSQGGTHPTKEKLANFLKNNT
jgi:sugar/nucleoside kinase (ribokinase family)